MTSFDPESSVTLQNTESMCRERKGPGHESDLELAEELLSLPSPPPPPPSSAHTRARVFSPRVPSLLCSRGDCALSLLVVADTIRSAELIGVPVSLSLLLEYEIWPFVIDRVASMTRRRRDGRSYVAKRRRRPYVIRATRSRVCVCDSFRLFSLVDMVICRSNLQPPPS